MYYPEHVFGRMRERGMNTELYNPGIRARVGERSMVAVKERGGISGH